MTRRRPTAPLVLAAFAVAAGLAGCNRGPAKTAAAPPPAPVVVGQATRRSVPVSIQAFGNVAAMASVAVRSRVEGPVVRVHIVDGATVVKGQVLFTIDPEPSRISLEKAEAGLTRDEALLAKADSDVSRYAKLVEKEYVTREQYEAATSQAAALRATIRSDHATVDDAKLNLSYCTIRAPIAGRTGGVAVKEGNLVKANEDPPLVTILQTKPVYVSFSVPEKELTGLRARAAAGRLEVRARERGDTGDGHAGHLAFIDSAVDPATGTIRLQGEFPNEDRGLWPGQFLGVEVVLSEQKDAVVVPSASIQVGQQGSYVYVVEQDGTARLQPVTVDRTLDGSSVISAGLAGGETVIVDGQIRVVPGAKVAAQPGGPAAASAP